MHYYLGLIYFLFLFPFKQNGKSTLFSRCNLLLWIIQVIGSTVVRNQQKMSHLKNETFLDWFLKCKIVLLVAPKVVPFLAPSNLQQGDRTTLTCTVARGDSPLTLMWKKDGLSLSDLQIPSIKIINFDEFNSMLTIESLHKLHIGNYSCAAVNSAGQSAVSTRINVQGINIFFFSLQSHLY